MPNICREKLTDCRLWHATGDVLTVETAGADSNRHRAETPRKAGDCHEHAKPHVTGVVRTPLIGAIVDWACASPDMTAFLAKRTLEGRAVQPMMRHITRTQPRKEAREDPAHGSS